VLGSQRHGMVGQGVKEVAGVKGNPFWGLGRGDAQRKALSVVVQQRRGSSLEKGSRSIKEVAGACTVLEEAPARLGDGRSDPSTRRASAAGVSTATGGFEATSD
jgi:hypothetical protein